MTSSPDDPFATPSATAGRAPADTPGYGQSAYGQAPYGTAGAAPRNGLGTAALVLGILAVLTVITVFGGIVLGLLAVVLGLVARGRVKRHEATNGGSATAGVVLGVIALLLSIALIVAGVSLLNSDSGQKLQDCLNDAGQDQAAVAACQSQFKDDLTG